MSADFVEFATIASSSRGNCVFVGTKNTKILIDAGLSGKKIEQGLSELDLTGSDIDAIFVTHEHNDHVDGIGVLSRRYDIPIYATEDTWKEMPKKVGEIREKNKNAVYAEEKFVLNDMELYPFEIPHDSADPVGYRISAFNKTITIATDIGHITDKILENTKNCDLLLIESNHDVNLVRSGIYPPMLKQRVLGDYGHLSNENCAKVLTHSIQQSGLKYALLGHLSNENNTPNLAFDTVNTVLNENGISLEKGDLNMYVSAPFGVKRKIVL